MQKKLAFIVTLGDTWALYFELRNEKFLRRWFVVADVSEERAKSIFTLRVGKYTSRKCL